MVSGKSYGESAGAQDHGEGQRTRISITWPTPPASRAEPGAHVLKHSQHDAEASANAQTGVGTRHGQACTGSERC